MHALRIWLIVSLLLATATGAQGQTPTSIDRSTARELGGEALIALGSHDYATARERLDRALSLHVAPTLYLARARANFGLGRLLAAAEDYRATLRFPTAQGEPPAFAQARAEARTELDALEPRLPRLTLNAASAVARVVVNDVEWPAAALGIGRIIDPGEYTVVASNKQGAAKSYRLVVGVGQRRQLELEAPALETRPESIPSPITPQPAPIVPQPMAAVHGSDHTAAYVLGAVTLALVAGAVVSGVIALDRRAEYNRRNHPDVAADEKRGLRSEASAWAWVNTGLVGGAVLAAGTTAYVYFSGSGETESGTRGPQGMVLGVSVQF